MTEDEPYVPAVTPLFAIAIVTGDEPLKLVPDNPVPIVNAFVVDAVTVVEPPKLTAFPLIVIELLVNPLFGILVNVFVEPLIDLLVSVCVPVSDTPSDIPYPAKVVGVPVIDEKAGVIVIVEAAVSCP